MKKYLIIKLLRLKFKIQYITIDKYVLTALSIRTEKQFKYDSCQKPYCMDCRANLHLPTKVKKQNNYLGTTVYFLPSLFFYLLTCIDWNEK